jgi:putative Mn2+ efflux pump MntP
MNIASTLLLAFAMSTDAFAAAVGKGATLHRPRIREALRTGLIFGVIEAITPLVGWALGKAAAPYVASWDHWIAFSLLFVLGARMVRSGPSTPTPDVEKPHSHGFWLLAVTGLATSIDAMAVGAGLAFIDVNILSTAATIGLATHGDPGRDGRALLGQGRWAACGDCRRVDSRRNRVSDSGRASWVYELR